MLAEDLTNKKFGKLLVIKLANRKDTRNYNIYWECKCECGNIHITSRSGLVNNLITSCRKCVIWKKPDKIGEITKTYYHTLKSKATERQLSFSISREELWDLFLKQDKKCALSGVDLAFSNTCYNKDRLTRTASLDRIDSNLGYTLDNVQWIHKRLNTMKMHFNNNEFINFCRLIVQKRNKEIYTG